MVHHRTILSKISFLAWWSFVVIVTGICAQNNQELIFKYCTAHPDDECFNPVNGAVDTVGREVNALGGGYKFCLSIDSINAGVAPMRIMLVLDGSGSMCNDYTPEQCCGGTGDSSGACAKNDPGNKRVDAAKLFVDNLTASSPASQVGVIVYASMPAVIIPPTALTSAENITAVKKAIDSAGCGMTPSSRISPPRSRGTNLGAALEAAVDLIGTNDSLKRHIILLTDGAWDDVATKSPTSIYQTYTAGGNKLPTVHGVFISDSALHVEHGYPAQGCASGTGGPVELTNLETAATATGGFFFGGATPQTIADNFKSLLQSLIIVEEQKLLQMVVTNKTNNKVSTEGVITSVASPDPKQAHYNATLSDLPLDFGMNTLEVRQIVQKPGKQTPDTNMSVVSIFRTKDWVTTVNEAEYELYCKKDKTTINITVTPPTLLVNEKFQVASTITIKDNFILDTVQARVFTQFPDVKDNLTIALFHLEGDLKNAVGTDSGTGNAVQYTATDHLFGKNALIGGFFTTTVGTLSEDFALEAWVKPSATTTQTEILSFNTMVLSLTSDRYLTVVSEGKEMAKSKFPIDTHVWSHVAVVRISNHLVLFINGIDASDMVPFTTTLSGLLKIVPPVNGVLDEVRISKTHRIRADSNNLLRLEVSTIQGISWTAASAQPVVQPVLIIPPVQWLNGSLKFNYSTPIAGRMVINFQHRGTTGETQWSKNSNVVEALIDTLGPYVKNSVFTRGSIGADFDTLDIELSEPVLCDSFKMNLSPSMSFEVYEVIENVKKLKPAIFDGAVYTDFSCPPNNLLTSVRVKVKPMLNGIVPKRDSIRAIGNYVVDTAGNTPDLLKYGPIQFGPGAGLLFKGIPNNPADPPMTINPNVRIRLGIPENKAKAKLIMLQTPEVLVQTGIVDNIPDYADYSVIYDPVGNVVCTHAPIRQSDLDPRIYYIVWDGLNKNNRRVSSGGYLIRAKVRYISDPLRPVIKQEKFQMEWDYKK